ncbi:unnamed protein product, partial [Heterosigma akashiwo]
EPETVETIRSDVQWEELENLKYIAKGAFCVVYSAQFQGLKIAVKKLRNDVKVSTGQRLMKAELKMLQQTDHENIVRLLGSGICEEPAEHVFLILEFISDGSLADFLSHRNSPSIPQNARGISIPDCLDFGVAFADAMSYLHHNACEAHFLLHRDLKPDNIGFSGGKLKLMDFGLAKFMPRQVANETGTYKMTGDTGTLRYMAPEVAVHQPYNEKADVYSFSLILWQLLTLERPFEGMSADDYYDYVVEQHVRPTLFEEWPAGLRELLHRCWHKRHSRRPNFPEVLSALKRLRAAYDDSLGRSPRSRHSS